jgi:hypothetical protein
MRAVRLQSRRRAQRRQVAFRFHFRREVKLP